MNTKTSTSRRFAVITAAVLAGSLTLSACGTSSDGGNDNTGATSGSSKLTVWHYFSDENQVKLMDEYAAKFEAANNGVDVENVFVPYQN